MIYVCIYIYIYIYLVTILDTLTTEKYELDSRQVYEFFLLPRVYTGCRDPTHPSVRKRPRLLPQFQGGQDVWLITKLRMVPTSS